MNRAGYSEDCDDNWQHIMWRGQVASSIRGRRGQAFLKELVAALDAMPQKRLIKNELRSSDGVCAIGSVGAARGLNLEALDPDDYNSIAGAFGIAAPLVRELEYANDECGRHRETPEDRWQRVRDWAVSQIKPNA